MLQGTLTVLGIWSETLDDTIYLVSLEPDLLNTHVVARTPEQLGSVRPHTRTERGSSKSVSPSPTTPTPYRRGRFATSGRSTFTQLINLLEPRRWQSTRQRGPDEPSDLVTRVEPKNETLYGRTVEETSTKERKDRTVS